MRMRKVFEFRPDIRIAVERIHAIVCFDGHCQIKNCEFYKNKLQYIVDNDPQWQDKLIDRLNEQKRKFFESKK
jgi:hypothetical protein